jgi:hypothetical protein
LPQNARVEAGVSTLDSDEDLVARCREQRDEAAFAELVRRYRDRVFRLASRFSARDSRERPKR